uniref:Cytochrome P450 n=1 Tax=Chenopodium quinoa TaxID=63459 RepID=A0A803NDV2_CHEQI
MLAGSSPVNLSEMLMDYTKDVLGRLVIERKLSGTGKDDGTVFNKLVNEVVSRLNGWDLKADKVYKELDQFFEKMISEHRDQLVDDDNSERVKDFVDVLLNIHEDSNRFPIDRDTVKAIVLNMIIAGTDTSAILLEWTMSELLRHPQVMQQLLNEVRTIMGENVHVNDSDLEQMKYLKAVIKETLRLHPPIPLLIFRQPTQDTEILGYDVPAGRAVTINCWAIQRDPISWDEPEKFKPERFLISSTDFRGQDLQLIPFPAGRRMCPGISLAMANIEFLLANLLLKFDWTLPGGVDGGTLDMSERFGISLSRNTLLFAVALQ